jgi:hypothetical protein
MSLKRSRERCRAGLLDLERSSFSGLKKKRKELKCNKNRQEEQIYYFNSLLKDHQTKRRHNFG